MYYSDIKYLDVANGDGVRTSLFVSGCKNKCKGCFNECTWDFFYGKEYTENVEKDILDSIDKSFVSGLSLLGGDPMEIENQPTILQLIKAFRERYGNKKTVWMWTGYLYDKDLTIGGKRFVEGVTNQILDDIDVIIDGPFVQKLKDLTLRFRGSSNQRIINLNEERSSKNLI